MTTTSVDMFAQPVQDETGRLPDVPTKFARWAEQNPDADAVRWTGKAWSARTLQRRAGRYAQLLGERVPAGGWVAVCAERSPEVLALVLGAFAAGRAVVPLEPEHPVSRLRTTLEDAAPALLVTDHTAARELTLGYEADKALLDELAAEAMLYDDDGLPAPHPDDVAYVIYTSGSTGRPKGVMVEHAQLSALAENVERAEPTVRAGNVVLSVASLAFDMMIIDLFTSLANGATVVLPPGGNKQREPLAMLDAVEKHEVDTFYATPSLLQMLVLAGLGTDGRRRTRVITGGEAMGADLARTLLQRCSAVYQGYGPTETTVLCSYHRVVDPGYLPLGRPSPGTLYYPVDDDLEVAPLNTRAELAIGGNLVSAGYHRRPRLTAEKYRPDGYSDVPGARCFLSGDLVKVDTRGGALFAGRKDTQVKIRGHRVELGEVEAAVLRQPGVTQCVVTTGEDALGSTELVAYVVGERTESLRTRLVEELPASMVPTRFVTLDAVPLTANGKPDRDAMARAGTTTEQADRATAGPANELETRIAQLWSEILGAGDVGLDDGFFDLGGHSLLAMEIVARIRNDFGVDLPVWELFSVPTVRAWAVALQEAMQDGGETGGDRQSAPATFAQAALCVAEQVVPGITSPGLVVSAALDGDLDIGELLAAFDRVIGRHDMLRIRFELRGADSLQVVEPYVAIDFDETVAADRAEAAAAVTEWSGRPFDLAAGPLFRALLVEQVQDAGRTLHLCFHDAICDATSAQLVLAELAAEYGASGTAEAVAAAVGFADLARAQRGQASGAAAAGLVNTWRSRLPKVTAGTGSDQSTAVRYLSLTAEANGRLRARAAAAGADLTAVLLDSLRAATGARLGGVLVPGRADGVEGMVGPLASTLLVPFTGEDLAGVRDDLAWAQQNAVPAEMLATQLQGSEQIRTVPQVVVALTPAQRRLDSGDPAVSFRAVPATGPDGPSPARTGVALSVQVEDVEGVARVVVQYRPDLVDAATVARLFD